MRDPLVDTTAPSKVEEVVWKRIAGYVLCIAFGTREIYAPHTRYPAASRKHMHITKAYLPRDVAKALAVNPPLVQKDRKSVV